MLRLLNPIEKPTGDLCTCNVVVPRLEALTPLGYVLHSKLHSITIQTNKRSNKKPESVRSVSKVYYGRVRLPYLVVEGT